MDLLFPDDGLVAQLNLILSSSPKWRLFTNNYTPGLSDTLASVTEAAWTSYAAVTKTWSDFTLNGVAAHNGYALASPAVFTNGTGGNVTAYGYYVTDSGNTKLLAIALFDAPQVIPAGGTLSVLPTWGDLSQLSA